MRLEASKPWVSLLTAICLSGNAFAASMAEMAGTYSVTFQPVTSGGRLIGCSLVYNAVMLDYTYQNGAPVLAVGNITFNQDKQPGLSLKLGLSNVLEASRTVEPPHYAFIKTKNGSTVGAKFQSFDSDVSGFRVFVYQLTEKTVNIIGDLLEGGNPTIGFNRTPNGLDATFTLDLTVENVAVPNGGMPQRRHSTAATEGFTSCFSELAAMRN